MDGIPGINGEMMMEDILTAHLLLSEAEFSTEVAASTAALAVELATGLIVHATAEAERIFHCRVKNGLNGTPFENLIPPQLRERHQLHVEGYARDPRPRAMGAATMRLFAQSLDGDTFPLAINLLPIKKSDRLYVIVTFMPLPSEEGT